MSHVRISTGDQVQKARGNEFGIQSRTCYDNCHTCTNCYMTEGVSVHADQTLYAKRAHERHRLYYSGRLFLFPDERVCKAVRGCSHHAEIPFPQSDRRGDRFCHPGRDTGKIFHPQRLYRRPAPAFPVRNDRHPLQFLGHRQHDHLRRQHAQQAVSLFCHYHVLLHSEGVPGKTGMAAGRRRFCRSLICDQAHGGRCQFPGSGRGSGRLRGRNRLHFCQEGQHAGRTRPGDRHVLLRFFLFKRASLCTGGFPAHDPFPGPDAAGRRRLGRRRPDVRNSRLPARSRQRDLHL